MLMKPIGVFIIFLLLCLFGCNKDSCYIPVTKFDPTRDAAKDIADALTEARTTGRNVILDVGGEWCIWCKRLDEFFAPSAIRKFYGVNWFSVTGIHLYSPC